jgi:hypothetical protein
VPSLGLLSLKKIDLHENIDLSDEVSREVLSNAFSRNPTYKNLIYFSEEQKQADKSQLSAKPIVLQNSIFSRYLYKDQTIQLKKDADYHILWHFAHQLCRGIGLLYMDMPITNIPLLMLKGLACLNIIKTTIFFGMVSYHYARKESFDVSFTMSKSKDASSSNCEFRGKLPLSIFNLGKNSDQNQANASMLVNENGDIKAVVHGNNIYAFNSHTNIDHFWLYSEKFPCHEVVYKSYPQFGIDFIIWQSNEFIKYRISKGYPFQIFPLFKNRKNINPIRSASTKNYIVAQECPIVAHERLYYHWNEDSEDGTRIDTGQWQKLIKIDVVDVVNDEYNEINIYDSKLIDLSDDGSRIIYLKDNQLYNSSIFDAADTIRYKEAPNKHNKYFFSQSYSIPFKRKNPKFENTIICKDNPAIIIAKVSSYTKNAKFNKETKQYKQAELKTEYICFDFENKVFNYLTPIQIEQFENKQIPITFSSFTKLNAPFKFDGFTLHKRVELNNLVKSNFLSMQKIKQQIDLSDNALVLREPLSKYFNK